MCGFWSSPFHGYAERGPEQSSRKFFTPLSAVSNKAVKNIRDDKGLKLVLVICSQKVSSTFTLLFFEGRTGSPTAPLLAFRSTRVAPGSDMGCGGSAQGARVHDLDAFADVSPSNSEVLAKPVPRLEHMRTMELRVISACNGWNWLAPCVNRPHFLLELNSHCRSQDSQSYWFTRTSLTKKMHNRAKIRGETDRGQNQKEGGERYLLGQQCPRQRAANQGATETLAPVLCCHKLTDPGMMSFQDVSSRRGESNRS